MNILCGRILDILITKDMDDVCKYGESVEQNFRVRDSPQYTI